VKWKIVCRDAPGRDMFADCVALRHHAKAADRMIQPDDCALPVMGVFAYPRRIEPLLRGAAASIANSDPAPALTSYPAYL